MGLLEILGLDKIRTRKPAPLVQIVPQVKEPKINLGDYYQQLSSNDLDSLYGKFVTLRLRDHDLVGKFLPKTFPEIDGYTFVYRRNKDEIGEIAHIFPSNCEDKKEESWKSKVYRIDDKTFFFDRSAGILVSHHYRGEKLFTNFGLLDRYLRQEVFDFETVK